VIVTADPVIATADPVIAATETAVETAIALSAVASVELLATVIPAMSGAAWTAVGTVTAIAGTASAVTLRN
jgi:hypothetical protein